MKGRKGVPLIAALAILPETTTAQTNIPIAQMLVREFLDSPSGPGGLHLFVSRNGLVDEGMQAGQNPAIHFVKAFGIRLQGRRLCLGIKTIQVGIERPELVRIVEGSKKFTLHLLYPFGVKLEVIPGRSVHHHVPTQSIGPVAVEHQIGIDGIGQTLGHFVTVLVQNQPVADHRSKSHAIKKHHRQGMQGKEPTPGLIHPFRDKVGRKRRRQTRCDGFGP